MEKEKNQGFKKGGGITLLLPLLKSLTSLKYGSEENTFLRLNATVHTNGRTSIMK